MGDPRTVLFADDAGEVPERELNGHSIACGFYWTEGLRGLGWAVDAVPTLKGGSTIGIPSPPAILLPDGRVVTPDLRDAERLQGFPTNWTKPAERVAKKGARWKLVGNAVSVPAAAWLGRRFKRPGVPFEFDTHPMHGHRHWPTAAWNVGDASGGECVGVAGAAKVPLARRVSLHSPAAAVGQSDGGVPRARGAGQIALRTGIPGGTRGALAANDTAQSFSCTRRAGCAGRGGLSSMTGMHGPDILARSLSIPSVRDRQGNLWQYHSRSDQHSKIACWALLFDLLGHCPQLMQHVAAGKVGFGINHEMRDFKNNRSKYLDLVICTPGGVADLEPVTFADLATQYAVRLTPMEREVLSSYPVLRKVPVGSVHLALEAKAAMTEHVKALPRLFDELNSSHLAIHGAADFAIAAGFALVNFAATFTSPGLNKCDLATHAPVVTNHKQPYVTERTIKKLEEIPRRTQGGAEGFDALGIVVLELHNDGSPVKIVTSPPAPSISDVWHYDQMIRRIASLYSSKFANV